MKIQQLKLAEKHFLKLYPGGFKNPEIIQISKKHRVDKMTATAHEMFAKDKFRNAKELVVNMGKIVARSSVVSVFEKPKFRDLMNDLEDGDMQFVSDSLFELLHGDQEQGFNALVDFLKPVKLAKWTLITVIPAYYYPDVEVFIKPTTVKNIIEIFELENIKYNSTPSYDFYVKFRNQIIEMKKHVDKSLQPNNLAFSGFLMSVM